MRRSSSASTQPWAVRGGQEMWRDLPPGQRDSAIREEFVQRLIALPGGWGVYTVEVSDRWKGPTDYYLLLMTQHPDGVWEFNNNVSTAMEEYRQACLAEAGQMELEPLAVREQAWVAEIEANIARLLSAGAFTIGDKVSEVYGTTLGYAREMHVRKAIKSLYAAGKTSTTGVGGVQRMRIKP